MAHTTRDNESFACNFVKCSLNFKILSPMDSAANFNRPKYLFKTPPYVKRVATRLCNVIYDLFHIIACFLTLIFHMVV